MDIFAKNKIELEIGAQGESRLEAQDAQEAHGAQENLIAQGVRSLAGKGLGGIGRKLFCRRRSFRRAVFTRTSFCVVMCLAVGAFLCAPLAGCGKQADYHVNQADTAGSAESGQDSGDMDDEAKKQDGADDASGNSSLGGALGTGDDVGDVGGLESDGVSGANGSGGTGSASGTGGAFGADGNGGSDGEPQDAQAQKVPIYVQVSGAVARPGVYELSEGSRIFEAIEMAGGLTEEADVRLLNQAKPVSDGEMIYVYAEGEEPLPEEVLAANSPAASDSVSDGASAGSEDSGDSGASGGDGLVNINTATKEQLMTLPGIGQSKAQLIISYRESQGTFEKIEDIMNIEGIKEGVFNKIKDHIRVD